MPYRFLTDISVSHEYYGGRCSSFSFVPTEVTADEMAHRNIVLRRNLGNLQILAPNESLDNLESMRFGVFLTDSNLYGVTNLKTSSDNISMVVVKDNTVFFSEIPLDECEKELRLRRPLFILNYQISKNHETTEILEIPLETRNCRWCYYIQGDIDLDDLKIYGLRGNDESDFDVYRKDEKSVAFISRHKYPIVYGDAPRFQLKTKKTSRLLLKAMPNMDYRSLSRIELNDNGYEIIAESFINL
ncbi:hypothetical protein [Fibrobacter sp. UWH6]|uniref:hypothetical protein n=1 Tax=Fibrobacter sp. (strain UWH6) TaxID=1896212 RepID=UPI000924000D|nr:hypothetical protein [Fibrobacter sp. UWH6]SHK70103.1 hypothetical protein SAMN05720765_104149 [Fibrobacter sp. UWH6]